MAQYDYASDLLRPQQDDEKPATYDYASELIAGSRVERLDPPPVSRENIKGSIFSRTLDAPGMSALQRQAASAKAGLGFFLNANERARADIIRNNFPNAEFGRDETGRIVVRGSPNEPYAYINAPGFGAQEAVDIVGDVVKFAPASRAAQGLSLAGRIGAGAALAGATSAGSDLASGLLGSDQGVDPVKAALSAAGQASGEVVATGLAGLLRRARGAAASGDDLARTLESEAAKAARRSTAGAQAADDLARQFDIPLTRGQATGSLEQQAFESRALRGALGDRAQQTLETFSRDQARRVADAGSRLSGARVAANPNEAGAIVREGLSRRAESARHAIDAAYDLARAHNAKLDVAAVPALADNVIRSAPEEVINLLDIDPRSAARSFPQATSAIRATKRLFSETARVGLQDDIVRAVDFARIEQHRRLLNALAQDAAPSDRRAVLMMKEGLDGWLDSAVAKNLFEGDEAFLSAFKNARALRAQYGRLFQSNGAKDFAGKTIDDIIRNNPTPEETLNLLFGASKIGAKRGVSETVRRIKSIAAGGEEFQALRDAAVDRIMKRGFARAGDQFRVGALIEQWDDALNGSGQSVMNDLFEPSEIATMRRYMTLLKRLEPKPGAVNTSNTAIEAMRLARGALGKFIRIPNLAVDRLLTGVADPNAIRARAAVQGFRPPLTLPPPASSVGAAILPPLVDQESQ